MKSKRLWTLAAAAVVLLTVTIAAQGDDFVVLEPTNPDLGLRTDDPFFGDVAHLQISVPPYYVGGQAELFVMVEETGQIEPIMQFEFVAPDFMIDAPTIGFPGCNLVYQYVAYDPCGAPLGSSGTAKRPYVPPEWDE